MFRLRPLVLLSVVLGLTAASHQPPEHETDYTGKPLWNATYTDQLKRDLLATYDKFARPSHHNNVTMVYLDIDVKHVHLDDAKSLFTVNAWVRLSWKDDKLVWNSSDYGGLSVLHLADHEIWEPDIVLYNSALGNNIDHYGNTHCLAQSTGDILWVPPSQFVVFCNLDLTKWPYDKHSCVLSLGSWTYHGEQVDLQIKPGAKEKEKGVEIDVEVEWSVIDITKRRHMAKYACCPEPYIDIEITITVQRHATPYRSIVLIPAISCVLLTLTSLWLPVEGRERYLLSAMTALLVSIFLLYFTVRLPVVGPHTPLIVLFYGYNLVMITVSIVLTTVCYNLGGSRIRLPRIVVNILRGPISTALLLPSTKSKIAYAQEGYEDESSGCGGEELRAYESEAEEKRILRGRGPGEGWSLVSAALDRLLFFIYLIIFISFIFRALL